MPELLAPPVGAFPQPLSRAVQDATAAFFKPHGLAHEPAAERGASGAGIMSTISFVGDYQWAFALSFPEGTAVAFAQAFAGFPIPFDSPDMGDVVGEIVNVIAGDVVGRLAKAEIAAQMSLPTTVRGDNVDMLVPSDASSARVMFSGPDGACWCDLIATPLPAHRTEPEPPEPEPTPAPVASSAKGAAPAPRTPADEALAAWEAAQAEAERELAEQDAAEAALRAANGGSIPAQPMSAPAAPTASKTGARRELLYLTLVFACGGWGAAAGLLLAGKKQPTPAPVAPAPEGAPAPGTAVGPAAALDAAVLAGRFSEGLQQCLDAPKRAPELSATARALREGLCLEGMGRWGEAAVAYRTAEADPNVAVWALALLGQARCAVQDESYTLAKILANRVLLRSGHPALRGVKLTDEVGHLRARIALAESGGTALPRDATVRPLLSLSASNGLDWLGRVPPAEATAAPGREVVEVHRTLAAPDVPQVTLALSSRPTMAAVRVLAATAGWKVQADDRAAVLLSRELGPLEVDHMTLPDFLHALTAGTGVTCELRAGALTLTAP